MSTTSYQQFVGEMELIAKRSKQILHDKEVSGAVRRAFFKANQEEEVIQKSAGLGIDFPYMLLTEPRFNYKQDGDVNKEVLVGFEIRDKISENGATGEILEVQERCQGIAEKIMALILLKSEDEPFGVFHAFDAESVKIEFTDAEIAGHYGAVALFTIKQEAWNPFDFNEDDDFNEEDGDETPTPSEGDNEWEEIDW